MRDQAGMGMAVFLRGAEREVHYCRPQTLADQAGVELARLPYTVKVLLETVVSDGQIEVRRAPRLG